MIIEELSYSEKENLKRRNLNLSQEAWRIIDLDMQLFMQNEKKQLSTFLNIVFSNFYQKSKASINIMINKYKKKIKDVIGDDDIILNKLVDNYEQELSKELLNNRANVNSKIIDIKNKVKEAKFKLNNENFDIITNSLDVSHKFYNNKDRLYINAVFEEYTKLKGYEREKIYFKKYLDIHLLSKEKYKVQITLVSGFKFNFTALDYYTDDTQSYLYLAGIRDASNGENKPFCFRVSNIVKMVILTNETTNKRVLDGLDKKIKQNGIMYFTQELSEFKIKLTKEGIELYNKTFNMRPNVYNIEDDIYTFYSTEFQIKTYFFKFGDKALVLSPSSLNEDFLKEYENAVKVYKKESKR